MISPGVDPNAVYGREAELAKRAALEKQRAAQGLGPEGQAAERTLQATAAEIEANKRCVQVLFLFLLIFFKLVSDLSSHDVWVLLFNLCSRSLEDLPEIWALEASVGSSCKIYRV